MAIQFSCPISGNQRDLTTIRFVAFFTWLLSIASLGLVYTGYGQYATVLVGLLTIDFIIRAFYKPKYSGLAFIGRGLVSGLKLPRKMVDGASKVFAARIGVVFTLTSTLLFSIGLYSQGTVVLGILILCAALEAFVGFCVGCAVYSLLPRSIGALLSK